MSHPAPPPGMRAVRDARGVGMHPDEDPVIYVPIDAPTPEEVRAAVEAEDALMTAGAPKGSVVRRGGRVHTYSERQRDPRLRPKKVARDAQPAPATGSSSTAAAAAAAAPSEGVDDDDDEDCVGMTGEEWLAREAAREQRRQQQQRR